MIPAGQLNRRVEIWNPTESQSTSGEIDLSYSKSTTVWCSVIADISVENIIGGKRTITQKYKLTMRTNSLLASNSQLVLYDSGSSVDSVEMAVEGIRYIDDVMEVTGVVND